ncbi:MAG TPA: hypothetical protein VGP10_05195 [Marisediminicola sp.]|nr:hypothetical protein [Marisediminicola sp.]
MRRIVLDTDVAALAIKQRLPAALARELIAAESGITFVTYGELTRWSIMRPVHEGTGVEAEVGRELGRRTPSHRRRHHLLRGHTA